MEKEEYKEKRRRKIKRRIENEKGREIEESEEE